MVRLRHARIGVLGAVIALAPSLAAAQEPVPVSSPDAEDADIPSPDGQDVEPAPQAAPSDNETQEKPDVLAEVLVPQAGGLTPDAVAQRALGESPELERRDAEVDAAEAVVDQAFVGYFPIFSVRASYTRVSAVPNVTVIGPCPGAPNITCTLTEDEFTSTGLSSGGTGVIGVRSLTPLFLNRYSIVHSIVVPLSDYFLTIPQVHEAAKQNVRARELDQQMQEAVVATNARIALYAWVAAVGQRNVAKLAIDKEKAHVAQAEILMPQGLATRADVLALEAQVATSEQLLVEAEAAVTLTGEQLRLAMGAPSSETLTLGFDVLAASVEGPSESLAAYYRRALRQRVELRALAATTRSIESQEQLARADYAPRVSLFANAYLMNPNPRQIPGRAQWFATWDAGVRVTWTVNDAFTSIGRVAEAEANTRVIRSQRAIVERAIRIEVATAFTDVKKAAATIKATSRRVEVATEALRAQEELFAVGEGGGLDIIDSETVLTRARFAHLKAHIDFLVARARFEHAVGDNVKEAE